MNQAQINEARQARIDGVWDNPQLLKLGPLSTDVEYDLKRIDQMYAPNPRVAWDVYRDGKKIDTVFQQRFANVGGHEFTAEDVRESLVNHDGYSPGITVRKA